MLSIPEKEKKGEITVKGQGLNSNSVGNITLNQKFSQNILRKGCRWTKSFLGAALLTTAILGNVNAKDEPVIGERPAVETFIEQNDIDQGQVELNELFDHGSLLFTAQFNILDGQGRPASTGTGAPRFPDEPPFTRVSSPESNSCSGCHNQPVAGGAGDFVANVFVLGQAADPVLDTIDPGFSNERNTLGMNGAGPIEMLAREMSEELIAIREDSKAEAAATLQPVTRSLTAKGVDFGSVTVTPAGKVDPSQIEGVDWDLIIKPFHQKGAVVSIREFTNNAMNHHHGMQSVERFGLGTDPDGDTVKDELTVGDITAITIFQAALNTPCRNFSEQKARRDAAERGETLFDQIECTSCHITALTLKSRFFTEPNPFNPPGNLQEGDVPQPFSFDMTQEGQKPRLEHGT